MDFQTAIRTCLYKYVTFDGRASRPEFWWFVLCVVIGKLFFSSIDRMLFGGGFFYPDMMGYHMSGHGFWSYGMMSYGVWVPGPRPLSFLFGLAIFLPMLSVAVRRLHDVGRSGLWLLIAIFPVIGSIVLLVWYLTPGTLGSNMYGVDPND